MIPTLLCDFYKLGHKEQYPNGTQRVYSTWTPRGNKHLPKVDKCVVFGVQQFLKFMVEAFNEDFFKKDKDVAIKEYSRYLIHCLGIKEPDTSHIEALHDLGYLPLHIKSLPEGTAVNMGVPVLTIENTIDEFFWLTNYMETLASTMLWKPMTTASIARKYRQILERYTSLTGGDPSFTDFQGHDFSMRGMSGLGDVMSSGMGHLLFFKGTDSIPAIMGVEATYGGDIEKELIGCSVSASEHSVMCAGGFDDEYETYRRLIEDVYPSGIVSIVSDTWDLWKVVTEILPKLKDKIMARDGKVVIRPDSGNPADILCGKDFDITVHDSEEDRTAGRLNVSAVLGVPYGTQTPEQKGLIELLWDTFGGTINDKGYKELDSHIGAIYGEAITLDMCEDICRRLMEKGFASTNVVFGIGSYTYQHVTRDSLGFAMKATSVVINDKRKAIFKDPITDKGGVKKSQYGIVAVVRDESGDLICVDERTMRSMDLLSCELQTVFLNGNCNNVTWKEVRDRALKTL